MPTESRDRLKYMRATFANCIHQLDASLASWVIRCCMNFNINIYTVHDCFITNALNAIKFPTFYTVSFMNLLEPLYIVNRLIYDNLIRYSSIKHSMTVIDSCYGKKILDIRLKDKDEIKSTHHWISEDVLRRVFNSLAAEQRFFNAKRCEAVIIR